MGRWIVLAGMSFVFFSCRIFGLCKSTTIDEIGNFEIDRTHILYTLDLRSEGFHVGGTHPEFRSVGSP